MQAPVAGQQIDPIAPVEMAERMDARQPKGKARRLLKSLILVVSLIALLAGGGLLLRYASRNPIYIAPTPENEEATEPMTEALTQDAPSERVSPEPDRPTDSLELTEEKEEAEVKLEGFLRAKEDLDRLGGAEWGGDLYVDMVQLSVEADKLFMSEKYASASDKYGDALAKAERLAAQSEDVLHRLIKEGQQALGEGDVDRAKQRFNVALKIDSVNEAAQHGLEKARVIETVRRLIESGTVHERENNLAFALTDYQQALEIDPESSDARAGLVRVKDQIVGEQFQQLMSSGFTALHNNDYDVARTAFLKAQSFKPGSPEVLDALAQVDHAMRQARIEALEGKALRAEQAEDWQQALESYVDVLETDPTIRFAIRGKERSLQQIRIAKEIEFYLERPHLLEFEGHLEKATRVLKEATGLVPKGPRLTVQVKELDQLVKISQTPVKISLESDNLTEVAVYRVGKLGRFYLRDLSLRPGTYTVVGTRDGYRDVRLKMVVTAVQEGIRVIVKCEEEIQ